MIRRTADSALYIRIELVRFKMSQTCNQDQNNSHMNIIKQPRRIPALKVIFEVCQCCRCGTMVWQEIKDHYEEFLCIYCMYIDIFDVDYFFM